MAAIVIVELSNKTPVDLDESFIHVTDAGGIAAIEYSFPNDEDFASYFVKIDDGDYSEVYGLYDRYNVTDHTYLYRVTLELK